MTDWVTPANSQENWNCNIDAHGVGYSVWDNDNSIWDGGATIWDKISQSDWQIPVATKENYNCNIDAQTIGYSVWDNGNSIWDNGVTLWDKISQGLWSQPANLKEIWDCALKKDDPEIPPPIEPPVPECPEITCTTLESDVYSFDYPGLIGSGDLQYAGIDETQAPSDLNLHLLSLPIIGVRTDRTVPDSLNVNYMRAGIYDSNVDPTYRCDLGDETTGVLYDGDIWESGSEQGVDLMITHAFDDANNRINVEITVYNISGEEQTNVLVGVGNRPRAGVGVGSSVVRGTPPERSIIGQVDGYTETIELFMPDENYVYTTRAGWDYSEYKFYDPHYIINTPDSSADPNMGHSIAANIGSIPVDGCKTINFSYIFG